MAFLLELAGAGVDVATVLVAMLASFPYEAVPDGHIGAPHHLYVGVIMLGFVVWVVADNYRRREPLLAAGGACVALFAFASVWQYYPPVGAAGSLTGLTLALVGVLWPGGVWADYPRRWRLAALLAVYIAADDVLEHAFGLPMPLDLVWMKWLGPFVSSL